ncbi:hypothetical protein [Anaeromyxobacter oryzae]|uniref:Uncharacterized protein n=1 Tax=Anaeromyxobacter oryzae TaxID=2918170 RepID=A0ABM7X413_9BACT|nr:hypothetical protein [Anaeromyxobacter oryzae]BDG06541.1 hypothetical protein AMOR_55370 [Anaeromyxobacter oryzae]
MRRLTRLLALVGAVGIGAFLFRAAPRDVDLVYDLSSVPGATRVEVWLRKGGELVRRTELSVPAGAMQVRHRVQLPDGVYELEFRIEKIPGGEVTGRRPLEVREGGTIVLPLGP